jgi:hypothetical protein
MDGGNMYILHRHMNVRIGTEAALFPEKKYIMEIFFAVQISHTFLIRILLTSLTSVSNFSVGFYSTYIYLGAHDRGRMLVNLQIRDQKIGSMP